MINHSKTKFDRNKVQSNKFLKTYFFLCDFRLIVTNLMSCEEEIFLKNLRYLSVSPAKIKALSKFILILKFQFDEQLPLAISHFLMREISKRNLNMLRITKQTN